MRRFLLGYNTNGFAHHRLDDCLAILADLGYEAVALTPDVQHLDPDRATPAEVDAVARRLAQLRLLPVLETGARFVLDPRAKHEPTLVSPRPEARARRLASLERSLDLAARLGSRCVSFWSGRLASGVDPGLAFEWLSDSCRRLADRALDLGIDLAFEPEPGMFTESMADFARLHSRVAHPRFRLTIDLGHLLLTESPPLTRAIRDWAAALANVHIEDMRRPVHEHLMFGEGEVPFDELLGELDAIEYAGVVSVELSRHSHAAPEAARRSIEFLGSRLASRRRGR